jgi:hypothetical protein
LATGILRKWMALHQRWGCRVLLLSLILVVAFFPYLQVYTTVPGLSALKAYILISGMAAVGAGSRHLWIAAGLGAIDIGLSSAVEMLSREYEWANSLSWARMLLMGVLAVYAVYFVLRFVLGAREITRDQIYAGISMYLLIGFVFASLYFLLLTLDPGSFAVQGSLRVAMGPIPDVMYFSFVTLTTLGYGDITPVNPIARSLSILEGLSGTLYMATFMARLVSLHAARRQ